MSPAARNTTQREGNTMVRQGWGVYGNESGRLDSDVVDSDVVDSDVVDSDAFISELFGSE